MNNNGAPNYFSNNMEGLHFFRQNLEVCIFSRSKYERAVGNIFGWNMGLSVENVKHGGSKTFFDRIMGPEIILRTSHYSFHWSSPETYRNSTFRFCTAVLVLRLRHPFNYTTLPNIYWIYFWFSRFNPMFPRYADLWHSVARTAGICTDYTKSSPIHFTGYDLRRFSYVWQ